MEWIEKLPEALRDELNPHRDALCNVRLFAGKKGFADTLTGEKRLQCCPDAEELLRIAQALCGHMLRLSPEKTENGYMTLPGGHRMGLCGRITMNGRQPALQEIGSVCIRVAHEIKGCGQKTAEIFLKEKCGLLLAGPPGSGKTTILRDAVRLISDAGIAIGLSDERGEIAACVDGVPQLDVGRRTHVADGLGKAEALRWLLRGMSPQLLAMDELYGTEECRAVCEAAACGVPVLATAHAEDIRTLRRRGEIGKLLKQGAFSRVMIVSEKKIVRVWTEEEIRCCGQ